MHLSSVRRCACERDSEHSRSEDVRSQPATAFKIDGQFRHYLKENGVFIESVLRIGPQTNGDNPTLLAALTRRRLHFLITILLVEDSRFLRITSERALVKAGYDVVSAVDGEAALLTARERLPNLILLDMMLPKLDGLGVLRALKRDPETANIPVIVLTGLGKNNEWKLKKEGAAAYFTKSDSLLEDDSSTLLHVVESVVGKQERVGASSAPVN
jgi:CheY-like chemotaxis protein